MKTEKTDNLQRFQGVIDFVNKTGVGYRRFYFRTNMSYDELYNFANEKEDAFQEFPRDAVRSGILIIKFSDGKNFLGSLRLSKEDLERCVEMPGEDRDRDVVLPMVEVGERLLGINDDINITLHFQTLKDVDGTAGYAIVEVMPSEPEKLKQWYSEAVSVPKPGWFASFLEKIWK